MKRPLGNRRSPRTHAAFALLAAAGLLTAASTIDFSSEGKLWWSHVQFLADDKLEGRNVGTEGFRKAVEYVASHFEQYGLKPAGRSRYLQPIHFESRTLIRDQSSLTLVRNGKDEPLALGSEANLSPRPGLPASVEAPLVFVGYGVSIPEAHYDELAGLDLRGKIAVYVNGTGPVDAPGPLKSHYSSGVERWAALRKAGAIGIATIQNPRPAAARNPSATETTPPAEGADAAAGGAGRGGARTPQPSITLADKSLSETTGQQVALNLTARGAEKLFAGTGHSFEEIQKLARANEPLPKFPLNASLRVKAAVRREPLESENVVGLLPGSDRLLKKEFVVLSAHLDHLGVTTPLNGDTIFNGAMDDASGIATLLEVARLMQQSGVKPKRSIIFLAVTAEEKGELGSRYFAAHPTVPAKNIVANINMDMFLPLYPLKFLEVQGLGESTLGDSVRTAAQELGVTVQPDNEPEQNRFIRSDQYSFIRNGVPALAFKFGYEAGSPEEKIRRDWVRERYHRRNDDLSQPVDQAAAALFNRVIFNLVNRVADDASRPHWNRDSFFRRFAQPER